jgi:hypothetical protein
MRTKQRADGKEQSIKRTSNGYGNNARIGDVKR